MVEPATANAATRYRPATAGQGSAPSLRDVPALLQAIAARGLKAGCASVGVIPRNLLDHRKKDPELNRLVLEALKQSGFIPPSTSDDQWDSYLQKLRTTSYQVLRRDRDCPSSTAVWRRRRRDPEFDRRYREILASRKFEKTRVVGKRGNATRKSPGEMNAIWARFLELLVGRTVGEVADTPGMPGKTAFLWKRRRDPAFDEAAAAVLASRTIFRHAHPVSEARIDALIAATEQLGFIRACMLPETASWGWAYRANRVDPAFARRLSDARAVHRERVLEMLADRRSARETAAQAKREAAFQRRQAKAARAERNKTPLGEVFNRQLRQNDLYKLAASAASAGAKFLQGDARDDLIADLVLGVLNGEYGPQDLKSQAGKLQSRHYAALRDSTSMDSERAPGDDRTLHETIGAWDYA